MKYWFVSLPAFLMTFLVMGQEVTPIQQFGESGAKAPTFFGEPLNHDFFAKSQMAAIADGRNYLSVWQIPKAQGEKMTEMQLFIANLSERNTKVVLSAEKGTEIRNFVVAVAAQDEIGLEASVLAKFERVFLISVAPISVTAISRPELSEPIYTDLEVLEPRMTDREPQFGKSTNYCSSLYGKPITMWGYDSANQVWTSVDAYADRTNFQSGTWYWIRVHYPVYGAIFHNHTGSYQQTQQCRSSYHSTYAASTGKSLSWTGMADFMTGLSSNATAVNYSDPSEFWNIVSN